jgi:energy-converting hydrogenase A subunit M
MIRYLYEKDLRMMKYNILTSTLHDRLVAELAERYGIRKQDLRKTLIERCDMSLLENLTPRYEVALRTGNTSDEVARELGCELLTRYIPLIDRGSMKTILDEVRRDIMQGTASEDAIRQGKAKIRELIRS